MALASPAITSVAIMLDARPSLTGALQIQRVPVVFIEGQRLDGPITEWVLAQRLLQVRGSSDAP